MKYLLQADEEATLESKFCDENMNKSTFHLISDDMSKNIAQDGERETLAASNKTEGEIQLHCRSGNTRK